MTYNINSPVTLLNSPSNCTRLYMTHKSPTLTTILPMNYPIPRTFSHDYSTPPTPCTSPHYYHTTHIPSNPYHLPLIGCVTQSNFFYKLDFIDELMYDIKIYNTVLLCYNLHWSLLTSQFLSDFYPIPDLYAKIPPSYANIFLFIFHCAGNIHIWVSILCLRYVVNDISCGMRRLGRRAGERWWQFFCGSVHAKLFWHAIYFANPRPNIEYHSGSRSLRGLGRRSMQIMQDYDLVNMITIRKLTQPRTCEMDSSIFSAMSRLKLESMTRYSFLSMPSTER